MARESLARSRHAEMMRWLAALETESRCVCRREISMSIVQPDLQRPVRQRLLNDKIERTITIYISRSDSGEGFMCAKDEFNRSMICRVDLKVEHSLAKCWL